MLENTNVVSGKSLSQWTKNKIEKDHLDCVAKNIIVFALDSNELLRVSKCVSTKDM